MAGSNHLDRDVAVDYRESVLSTRSLSYVSHASTYTMSRHCDSEFDVNMSDVDAPILPSTDVETQPLPASVAHSLLFELPRELRERIYSLVLTTQDDEDKSIEWPTQVKKRPYHLQPALLRTCKIVLSEAAPLLYTQNTFEWTHPSDANVFVRAFASPIYGRQIARVRLDLKAGEMRLWMPYLTSTDDVRSLRADFPNMRELGVRYQSLQWAHNRSVEENLMSWCDDKKLDEMLRGLRSVFPSKVTDDLNDYDLGIGDQEFRDYLARNPVNFDDPNETREFRTRLHAAHKVHHEQKMRVARERAAALRKRYVSVPTIRVTCACRVPEAHFTYLTTSPAALELRSTGPDDAQTEPEAPVVEGEAYRGFTAIDFRNHIVKTFPAPDFGTVGVALTPYADRHGVLIALELDYNEPNVARID